MSGSYKSSFLFLLIFIFVLASFSSISSAYNSYSGETNTNSSSVSTLFGLILILFIIVIIIAALVYWDAERRGEKGGLWLTVIFLSNFIGLFIWLLIRPKTIPKKPYKNYNMNSNFQNKNTKSGFSYPNNYIDSRGRLCPNCGRPIPFDANICPYCGKRFKDYL